MKKILIALSICILLASTSISTVQVTQSVDDISNFSGFRIETTNEKTLVEEILSNPVNPNLKLIEDQREIPNFLSFDDVATSPKTSDKLMSLDTQGKHFENKPLIQLEGITNNDGPLIVGDDSPDETLYIYNTTYHHYGNVYVINQGKIIVEDAEFRVYGHILVFDEGKITSDSSIIGFLSISNWQFTINLYDNAEIEVENSGIYSNQFPNLLNCFDDSKASFVNVTFTDWLSCLCSDNSEITVKDCYGPRGFTSEFFFRDSSRGELIRIVGAINVFYIFQDGCVIDYSPFYKDAIDHFEFPADVPNAQGIHYSIIIDSCYLNGNSPLIENGANVTLRDCTSSIIIRPTNNDYLTISGLTSGTHHSNWEAPLSDRRIHLINTSVRNWHLQMFDNPTVSLENSIVSEILCVGNCSLYLNNVIYKGDAGPFWVWNSSVVFATNCAFFAEDPTGLNPVAYVRDNGFLVLYDSYVYTNFFLEDDAVVFLLNSESYREPILMDRSSLWFASINSPSSCSRSDSVPISGSAYIDVGPEYITDIFRSYQLYYASPPDYDKFEPIGSSKFKPVRDGILGYWDTSSLDKGLYILKLELRDKFGYNVSTYWKVNVQEKKSISAKLTTRHSFFTSKNIISAIASKPDFSMSKLTVSDETFFVDDLLVKEGGYRVDWSHNLDMISFDQQEADGYYDIYTMNPDGTGEQCLTDNPNIPGGHKGCAAWHPSGEYIVFTCEKEKYFGKRLFLLSRWLSKLAVPGEGINCDLWVMKNDGSEFWQLTNLPTKTRFLDKQPYTGVLHPHFSHDGTKLFWTERVGQGGKWGEWTINVADFVTAGDNPHLDNIKVYQPGNVPCFYESHGFSPDDKKIIFSGNLEVGQDENHLDIYTLDLETEELVRLTDSIDEWDEHAHYSPDGEKIVWMSSNGYGMSTVREWWDVLRTDYWVMNANGSEKTQLTFYNFDLEDDERVICSDCSWNADGTKLATTMLIVDGDAITGGIAILDFSVCENGIYEKSRTVENYMRGYPVKNITIIKEHGGRVDWSHSGNNLIAFDRRGEDGYYDIYTMKPDGSDEICLTCNHPDLPNKNIGQPAWHPSGEYIVLQAEKKKHRRVLSLATNPGAGHFNDLWVLNIETINATILYEIPNDKDHGVLHPHFSNDGTKLSWSEMYEKPSIFKKDKVAGYWKLKVADFVVPSSGVPMLENISEFMPGEMAFYENHGFSPDDAKLIFCGNQRGTPVLEQTNIYTIDLETQSMTQLTNEAYNEHAIFSPDGEKIVWMSDKNNRRGGTDYWLMNPDGSEKIRLTYFNQPGHPHYMGKKITAADSSWSPDGKRIVGYYHDMRNILQYILSSEKLKETIVMIELAENGSVFGHGIGEVDETWNSRLQDCREGHNIKNITITKENEEGGCPEDCVTYGFEVDCGDGICQPEKGENSSNCPEDCEWESHTPPRSPKIWQMLWWMMRWANRPFPEYEGIQPCVKNIEVFREGGSYPDWSCKKNLIVFTQAEGNIEQYKGTDGEHRWRGKFEIYTMEPDGTNVKCLTCNKSGAPNGGKGQPFWHPNGEYIVFTVETEHSEHRMASLPGLGLNYDIWIMTTDGNKYWRITNYPENWGVNRAMFSPDGETLHWDEEYSMEEYPGVGSLWSWQNPIGEEGGLWRTKLANISFGSNGPEISNVQIVDYSPKGLSLLEPEGFSRDGKKLIFTAAKPKESRGHAWFGDIYTSDLKGDSLIRLTHTPYLHDENAEYSPDGNKIAWTVGSWMGWTCVHKQEMYLMNADGSNKKRLTHLNDPTSPHYIESENGVTAGESTWSRDGEEIIFHVFYGEQTTDPNVKLFESRLYKLTFEEPVCINGIYEVQ